MNPQNLSFRHLVWLSLAVLVITLFFGLRPKNYTFHNNVTRVSHPDGIRFAMYGIAYTDLLKLPENLSKHAFSMELAFKPAHFNKRGFGCLLMLHDGEDDRQWLVGQWHSWIIVMNGDDYDHRRKTPRISVNLAPRSQGARFLTITCDKEGTKLYLDGRLVRKIKGLRLTIPQGPDTRLILGNSVHGKMSWQGTIYGLAFFDYPLNNNQIETHFKSWHQNRLFLFAEKDKPTILYLFDEKASHKVVDHGTAGSHLKIPSMMHVINKKILVADWHKMRTGYGFIQDAAINLLGFIPLGFVLMSAFCKSGSVLGRHAILVTLASCFFVSLIIEILQVWLPTRSSDAFDLFFNTIGALTGICLYINILTSCTSNTRGDRKNKVDNKP